ncbi:MAG: hypothetical protein Q9202_006514 [Teloschistes flavicans]
MLQAVLVSPTAKLDISRLVEHSPSPSPSPSPPPTSTTSLPPLSRSFSIPATVDQSRVNTSHNTSSIPQYYATTGVSHPVPHQEVLAPLSTVVSGNKRTASPSPHELQQPNKKPPRQWSDSDSDELVKLRGQNMKWEDIARRFPNRSHVACRLRYQNYMERKYHWTDDKNGKLARLYESHKQAMWTSIAQDLNTPWRAVEHQHWMIGQEDMATLAGARMLHGDRSSRDSEVSGTRRQPLLPQMSGPSTTYNTGSASTYHRLSGGTGGRMPPLPGPPTTNGVSAPRFSAGGEETGLGFYRGNRKQRGSGGQLPSLGEMTSGVPAWAAHIDDRYYEEDEEEDDLKEEAEDPEMKQEP